MEGNIEKWLLQNGWTARVLLLGFRSIWANNIFNSIYLVYIPQPLDAKSECYKRPNFPTVQSILPLKITSMNE